MSKAWMLPFGLIAVFEACDSSSTTGPAPTPGPPPTLALSTGFDEAPLEGFLRLEPLTHDVDWEYSVDLDEDGSWDYAGPLERLLGYAYRFETPGIHAIRVRLEGEGDVLDYELPVVVNDPSAVSIVATGQAPVIEQYNTSFEGIVASPNGESLYVGDFSGGAIFRLDADDLTVRDTLLLDYGVEGLSISPSGNYLFAGSKYPIPAYRYALPELEIASPPGDWSYRRFFVQAIDDERALYSGFDAMIRDVPGDMVVQQFRTPAGQLFQAGPLSVAPDGTRVVLVDYEAGWSLLRLVSFPGAVHLSDLTLPDEDVYIEAVAFGPTGEHVFVSGDRALYVVEASSGETVQVWRLGSPFICSTYCVANPTALSRDGRFLAFELAEGVLFVDTERRIPLYQLERGASVATDPTVPAGFFLLEPSGHIRRVRVDP